MHELKYSQRKIQLLLACSICLLVVFRCNGNATGVGGGNPGGLFDGDGLLDDGADKTGNKGKPDKSSSNGAGLKNSDAKIKTDAKATSSKQTGAVTPKIQAKTSTQQHPPHPLKTNDRSARLNPLASQTSKGMVRVEPGPPDTNKRTVSAEQNPGPPGKSNPATIPPGITPVSTNPGPPSTNERTVSTEQNPGPPNTGKSNPAAIPPSITPVSVSPGPPDLNKETTLSR